MLYDILKINYTYKMAIEAAVIVALVFALTCLMGKIIIPMLRQKKANQPISDYVAEHASKSGTPTMGGICFIIASLLVLLCWVLLESAGIIAGENKKGAAGLIPFALTVCLGVANAMIGFVDDYKKLKGKRNEGLSESQKMILQVVVAAAYLCMMGMTNNLPTALNVPFTGIKLELGYFAYAIYLLVIVGFVNSTNITDGLDGLASSVGVASSMGIILMSVLASSLYFSYAPASFRYDAVVAASLLGGLLGFLVFNHYPAKVFMGDTGSLYIGGIIMGLAISSGQFIAVVIMGFVYVLDMLSSLLQRLYYKATHGKRLFLMAPVHHHYQKKNWSEVKIVTVFFIASVIFTAIGVLGTIL